MCGQGGVGSRGRVRAAMRRMLRPPRMEAEATEGSRRLVLFPLGREVGSSTQGGTGSPVAGSMGLAIQRDPRDAQLPESQGWSSPTGCQLL
jgi:hypothetical protein